MSELEITQFLLSRGWRREGRGQVGWWRDPESDGQLWSLFEAHRRQKAREQNVKQGAAN